MKIKIKSYKKVISTNDTALKLIKRNFSEPTLVVSESQTKGRGRIGKKWISNKGNLFISLFFKFDQRKINFKQYAVLNAFLLKQIISKITFKHINNNHNVLKSYFLKISNIDSIIYLAY